MQCAGERKVCTVEVSPAKSPDSGGAGQVYLPEKISKKPLTTSGVSGIIESKLPVKDAQLKHMFGNRKGQRCTTGQYLIAVKMMHRQAGTHKRGLIKTRL